MNKLCGGDVKIEISNPSIDTEHPTGDGRIDGLIMEEGKYAIIIENKIWDAVDQNEQIDKYVGFVKEQCKIPPENIFVIYLTRNGSKAVSKDSLSEKTKNTLGNHFIPMSFQYDILPWLEEDVLPNCKVKEKCLETAIYQYIDYLKGLFGQLNYQKQAQKSALKQILKDMSIEEYNKISKAHHEVQLLANALWECKCEMGKTVADKFQQLTREYFNKRDDFILQDNNQTHNNSPGYYQIYDERWPAIDFFYPHLEWIPLNCDVLFTQKELTFVLHLEGDYKSKNWLNRDHFAQLFLNKAQNHELSYLKKYDNDTYYKNVFSISDGKTFGELDEDGQRKFLEGVYSSKEIQTIIELINETIEEMKKQYEH